MGLVVSLHHNMPLRKFWNTKNVMKNADEVISACGWTLRESIFVIGHFQFDIVLECMVPINLKLSLNHTEIRFYP